MNDAMQPVVIAAIAGAERTSAAFELELNLHQVSNPAKFDWAQVSGRRVVVMPGNTQQLAKLADNLARVAVAARASSVAVSRLPPGMPPGWSVAEPLPPRVKPADIRAAVMAAEHKANAAGLPDRGLLDAARQAVPQFPVDEVFGEVVGKAARMAAAAAGAPTGYVCTSLLVAALGATCGCMLAAVRPGWVEHGALFGGVVGDPSASKSPSQRAIELPLDAIDRRRATEAKTLAELSGEDAKPIIARISDATIPSIYMLLATQGRGVMLHTHEGGTFFSSVAASWKTTTDRGAANALYDGRPLFWHRRTVSKAPLYIPRGSVSILLLVQPEAIAPAVGTDAISDGLLERFLFDWSAADPHQPQPSAGSLDWAYQVIARVIERCSALGDLAHLVGQEPITYTLNFSEKATERFIAWRDAVYAEDERLAGRVSSYVGKAPGQAARLALAIELIKWAMTDDPQPPSTISDESVEAAMRLRSDYYGVHLRKVLSDASMPAAEKLAAATARWIVNERPSQIDPLHLRTKAKVPGLRSREDLLVALGELESRNWLAPGVRIPHFRDFRAEMPTAIPLHPRLFEFV